MIRTRHRFYRAGMRAGIVGFAVVLFALSTSAQRVSIEELIRRNPQGGAIVEDLALAGVDEAMLLLCQTGLRGGASGDSPNQIIRNPSDEDLKWCSRAALLGHPSALRLLGAELLASPTPARAHEGLLLMTLAEVAGDEDAALEVSLLPDFFPVSQASIGRARREALVRIEVGDFHRPDILGFAFELSAGEEDSLRRRRLRYQQATAALADSGSELTRQLASRRHRVERRPLVSEAGRQIQKTRLESKDAFQARLSNELKRASLEPKLSEREALALADRQKRRRVGAELHTERIDDEVKARVEGDLERLLAQINRHRTSDNALRLVDVGPPWELDAAETGSEPSARVSATEAAQEAPER
jgi:hypothetical protein